MWMNILLLTALVGAVAALASRLWARNRHERAIRELLDGADALEAQLYDLKSRMERLRAAVAQLPPDMTGRTLSSLNPDAQVKAALKSVLEHRLWIKDVGGTASLAALQTAREAIAHTRDELNLQLKALDGVSDELAAAGRELKSAYQASASAKKALDVASAKALAVPGPKSRSKANGHAGLDS